MHFFMIPSLYARTSIYVLYKSHKKLLNVRFLPFAAYQLI